jgi:hypothetical protein
VKLRSFVLLLGGWLSLSNGGSLFAGVICQPESIGLGSDVFPKDIVPRDPVRPPAEDKRSESTSSDLALMTQSERAQTCTFVDESLELLGKSFNGPLEKQSGPSEQSNGIDGEDSSRPMPPQPSAPSERGESGAAPTVPTSRPTDQQIGLFALSAAPTPEREESLIFHIFDLTPTPASRVFSGPQRPANAPSRGKGDKAESSRLPRAVPLANATGTRSSLQSLTVG